MPAHSPTFTNESAPSSCSGRLQFRGQGLHAARRRAGSGSPSGARSAMPSTWFAPPAVGSTPRMLTGRTTRKSSVPDIDAAALQEAAQPAGRRRQRHVVDRSTEASLDFLDRREVETQPIEPPVRADGPFSGVGGGTCSPAPTVCHAAVRRVHDARPGLVGIGEGSALRHGDTLDGACVPADARHRPATSARRRRARSTPGRGFEAVLAAPWSSAP